MKDSASAACESGGGAIKGVNEAGVWSITVSGNEVPG
jgi:hypothetical protein